MTHVSTFSATSSRDLTTIYNDHHLAVYRYMCDLSHHVFQIRLRRSADTNVETLKTQATSYHVTRVKFHERRWNGSLAIIKHNAPKLESGTVVSGSVHSKIRGYVFIDSGQIRSMKTGNTTREDVARRRIFVVEKYRLHFVASSVSKHCMAFIHVGSAFSFLNTFLKQKI
jgi:hypothetical protein